MGLLIPEHRRSDQRERATDGAVTLLVTLDALETASRTRARAHGVFAKSRRSADRSRGSPSRLILTREVLMPARPLDLEVRHGSRREDTFQATGDPANAAWLQGQLRDWLTAKKWATSRWGEFELIARAAGRSKQLAKVRT